MFILSRKLFMAILTGLLLLYGISGVAALTTQELAKIALDSTLHIEVELTTDDQVTGSGFVIGEGLIATNHHVIEGAAVGTAKLVGETTAHKIESIRAVDETHDIAIVIVKGVNAPILPLGDSDAVQVGEKIYVAGNPKGLEGTFSDGIISGIRQESGVKLLQMTAPISDGSSGGPVLNSSGQVIGISVASRIDGQNLNFAVPINYLKALAATTVNNPLITEIHNLRTKNELSVLFSYGVAFSPDGRYIATGSNVNATVLWDVSTGELVTAYKPNVDNPEKSVWGLDFSPDGKYLAYGTHVGNDEQPILAIVNSNMEGVVETFLMPSSITRGEIYAVRFSQDSRYVAVSFSDNSRVLLWNLDNGNYKWWGRKNASRVDSLAFSPDGKYLATGHNNGTVIFYELSSWWSDNVNETQVELGGAIFDVAFSPDGNYFAADGNYLDDHNVSIYDTNNMATPSIIHQIDYKEFSPWAIAFSPDDKYLAVGGDDGRISFYETDANFTEVGSILVGVSIADLAWSPDGSLISDGEKVWKITENTESLIPLSPTDSTPSTTVRLTPSPMASPGLGEQLTLSLDIMTGKNVAGYQATLQFDTAVLRYVESANGDYLPTSAFFIPPVAEGNTLTLAASSVAGGSSGDGTLATITFEVVAAKASTVSLSSVLLADSVGGSSTPTTENAEITEPTQLPKDAQLPADVNDNGVINIVDLTLVAANFGQSGANDADVNGDGVVNIVDLTLVAAAIGNNSENGDTAAPVLWSLNHDNMPTRKIVEAWLQEARQLNFSDAAFQRGILVLEQLLTVLTPKETTLLPNYPNPFNPETWIPYQLSKPAAVMITIYASNGHVIRQLALGHQPAGVYQSRSRAAYWDGRNAVGEPVASGVYFYTLTAGDFSATRRMLIRK